VLGKTNTIVDCEFFTTNIFEVKIEQKKDYSNLDSFVIFICAKGPALISINNYDVKLKMGESVLIPANNETLVLQSDYAKLLNVYID